MKLLLFVSLVVLLVVLGYSLFARKHDTTNMVPSNEDEGGMGTLLSKYDERYALIARTIADDLSQLPTSNGEAFDARANDGGGFYGVGSIMVRDANEYFVTLVIRPTLPATHPNYYETSTDFSYVLRELEDGTFAVMERPDADAMQAAYQSQ